MAICRFLSFQAFNRIRILCQTRLGVDKVKPKGWFKYRLSVGWVSWWMWWVGWLIFVSAPSLLKMVHQVRLMKFSLKMVDYSMSFLSLCTSNFTDK